MLHPRWGAKFYPATMFAAAPAEVVVEQILAAAETTAVPEQWASLKDARDPEPSEPAPTAVAVAHA